MKDYELNGLGLWYTWKANDENHATELFLEDFGMDSLEAYVSYCKEIGVNHELNWREV